jgi:hypothetical protein
MQFDSRCLMLRIVEDIGRDNEIARKGSITPSGGY